MKEIILDDVFLQGLIELNPEVHTESNIFYKNITLYKIFTGEGCRKSTLNSYFRNKEKKIELISKFESLPHIVLPQDKLMKLNKSRKLFAGYSMEFLDTAVTLSDVCKSLDVKVLINLLNRISVSIKKIHKRNEKIVIGDLGFYNILVNLVDSIFDYFFIDFDNITIGDEFQSERISPLIKDYSEFKGIRLKVNKNFDRLTFLFYFFDTIFDKTITEVSMYEYDEMVEHISILKDLRNLVIELKKVEGTVPSIPYFHEIIGSQKTLKKVSSF